MKSSYSLKAEEEEFEISSLAHDLVKAKPMQEIEDEGIDEDQELIGGGVSRVHLGVSFKGVLHPQTRSRIWSTAKTNIEPKECE